MRALQATPETLADALELARRIGGEDVALSLDAPAACWDAIQAAGFAALGWWQASRDPRAAHAHPEWMHAPQHQEWLRRFPGFSGRHPALVAPYIGLGTLDAFDHALARFVAAASTAPVRQVLLADVQGPPMGCGCGNPSCRSWDNAPGEKVAPSAYEQPELLFPLRFFQAAQAACPALDLVPLLCAECERGIVLDGIDDPDGPGGTDLCQGVACVSPCATDYWPRLLAAFRAEKEDVGLVLTVDALDKDHPVYGEPRAWATRAHRHYGEELLPVIEPNDAARLARWLVVTDYRQDCWPVEAPPGYAPSVPPVRCGCD